MTEERQKDIEQLFEAMGNSGGRFVIGQVIGSQTNYIGDHLAQKDGKPPHEDIPHSEENVDDEDGSGDCPAIRLPRSMKVSG